MRVQNLLPTMALTILVTLSVGCGGARSVNLGDGSIGNMVWGVFHYWGTGETDKALAYADKAVELHGAEAREMQASLSDYPPTDPPEATYRYAALNGVAAALYAKGEILMKRGDTPGAVEAFTTVVEDYGYAQALDNKSKDEFWKPAERAKQRLSELRSGGN